MSKAILVMDMPENCTKCDFSTYSSGYIYCERIKKGLIKEPMNIRPDWCPLKPMPEEKQHAESVLEVFINTGYNSCIDELLKGEEG